MLVSVHLLHVLVQGEMSDGFHMGYMGLLVMCTRYKIFQNSDLPKISLWTTILLIFLTGPTHLNAYSHHSGLHI